MTFYIEVGYWCDAGYDGQWRGIRGSSQPSYHSCYCKHWKVSMVEGK